MMGCARIHGELLKLGFEVAQSSVAKYMVSRCDRRPRAGHLLRNHAPDIAAMDCFIVPTIGFGVALRPGHRAAGAPRPRLDQRHTSSNRGMVARQITEAFPWNEAPAT